eukprot:826525-Prorocentrum_minimum.AAC.1
MWTNQLSRVPPGAAEYATAVVASLTPIVTINKGWPYRVILHGSRHAAALGGTCLQRPQIIGRRIEFSRGRVA